MWKLIILTISASGVDLQSTEFQTREACTQTLRAIETIEGYEGEVPFARMWCVDDEPAIEGSEDHYPRVWD